MTVGELIEKLKLYPPECIAMIDGTGPNGCHPAEQVVQEACNAVYIHAEHNKLAVTYKADGVTPQDQNL